jgi:hypothetical protein
MADDTVPPLGPNAGLATDREIMKQIAEQMRREAAEAREQMLREAAENREQMRADFEAMHRDQAPAPGARHVDPQPERSPQLFDIRDWRLTPALVGMLAASLMGVAGWCWSLGSDVQDLKNANATYKEDRAKYREGIARDMQVMRDDLAVLPNLTYRLTQMETMPGTINTWMDRAFDVFNARFDGLAKAGADVSGDIKAMRSELEGMRRAVDRLEASRGGGAPFGRDQSWPTLQLPYSLRAKTECPMLSPLVREVALRG